MLKPSDCEINDTFTGCDPRSLAVMPRVEPGELRADKCALYNYALAQQSTSTNNKIHRAHTESLSGHIYSLYNH